MVRCLADYEHQEIRRSPSLAETVATTYNILLEYGDEDLDEYFARLLPPVFQTEVEGFWKGLFEVADAVEGIHNLKTDMDGEEYHGYVAIGLLLESFSQR